MFVIILSIYRKQLMRETLFCPIKIDDSNFFVYNCIDRMISRDVHPMADRMMTTLDIGP